MKKKLVAIISVVAMLVTMFPATVLAETTENAEQLTFTESANSASVTSRTELEKAINNEDINVIEITEDISMGDKAWEPVVLKRNLIINGNGHYIQNMTVNTSVIKPSGSGVAGDGGSCDYYAGFIGDVQGVSLTINDLEFTSAEVDVNPVSINMNSTGSSILAIVVGNNTGDVVLNNVEVTMSTVSGYTKVGLLHGFTQGGNGSFTANKCRLVGSTVCLEADGSDTEAAFSGLIIGYDGNNKAKVNGIEISQCQIMIDERVDWGTEPVYNGETGITSVNGYGLTCETYAKGSSGMDAVLFEAEVDGFAYETLEDAIKAADAGSEVIITHDVELTETLDINKSVSIDGNGYTISGESGSDSFIKINTDGDFSLTNCIVAPSGVIQPNAAISINGGGKISITDCIFGTETGNASVMYNGLEWGQNAIVKDGSVISGNTFYGNSFRHNCISFYTMEEGATINISNNNFVDLNWATSNGARISNYTSAGATINFEKNQLTTYGEDSDIAYAGLVVFQNNTGSAKNLSVNFVDQVINGKNIASNQPGTKYQTYYIYPADTDGENTPTFRFSGEVVVDDADRGVVAGENEVKAPEGVDSGVIDAVKDIDASDSMASIAEQNILELTGNVSADDAEKALGDNGITVDDGDTVTIVAEPYLEVAIESYDTESMTLDIGMYYNLKATISNDLDDMTDGNTVVISKKNPLPATEPVTITVPLPDGFVEGADDSVFVQHKGVYEYEAAVAGDDTTGFTATFTNPHGFSTFEFTKESKAAATVDGTSYLSLQEAVNAVEDGETIILAKDNGENVTVTKAVSFKIDKNGKNFNGTISAGSGYQLTESGGVYTVAVKQNTGGTTVTPSVTKSRVAGDDRFETAIKVADKLKSELGVVKFNNIVVANSDEFADALSATALAADKDAPILVVNKNNESIVKNYISANLNKGGNVYIIGGTAVVSESFEKSLTGCKVTRLGGSDRYETNL